MKPALLTVSVLLLASGVAVAQGPQPSKPQNEHEFLKKFAGEWTSKSKAVGSDAEYSGSIKSSMLGEFWVVNKMRGDMGGMKFDAIQTIGYDEKKKKYVGTWIDTMMNHRWHYEGSVDDAGTKLVLVAEGPDMMGEGNTTKYRDSYEFKSADLAIATSEMMNADGKWVTFMTGEVKRKKSE